MTNASVTTGSQVTIPFPPPMDLQTDNPSVVSVALDRNNAVLRAVGPGTCWLTLQPAGDVQMRLQVTVADPTPVAAAQPAKK